MGGWPDATEADPDAAAAAAAFTQMAPPMATTFATMQTSYDTAQGDGRWQTYVEVTEFLGHDVDLNATFFTLDELIDAAADADLLVISAERQAPGQNEGPTTRLAAPSIAGRGSETSAVRPHVPLASTHSGRRP